MACKPCDLTNWSGSFLLTVCFIVLIASARQADTVIFRLVKFDICVIDVFAICNHILSKHSVPSNVEMLFVKRRRM